MRPRYFPQRLSFRAPTSSDGPEGRPANRPRAFRCIKFATPAPIGGGAGAGAAAGPQTDPQTDPQAGQELLAVSASLQLFHFANVPIAALEVRPASPCHAKHCPRPC